MRITSEFSIAFKQLLFLCVGLIILQVFLMKIGPCGTDRQNTPQSSVIVFLTYYGISLVTTIFYWFIVGRLTDKKVGALIATIVSCLGTLSYFYQIEWPLPSFMVILVIAILPHFVFGYFYCKNKNALYFAIVGLVSLGLSIGSNTWLFEQIYGRFLPSKDIFIISIGSGCETSILQFIIPKLFKPISLVILCWIIQKIEEKKKIDLTLRTSDLNEKIDNTFYSVYFWTFSIVFSVCGLGIMKFISDTFEKPFQFETIIKIAIYFLAIYISAALYRNVVVSKFISHGRYPKLTFVFLNIPIVNIFAWLLSLGLFSDRSSKQNNDINIKSKGQKLKIVLENYALNKQGDSLKSNLSKILLLYVIFLFFSSQSGQNLNYTSAISPVASAAIFILFIWVSRSYFFLLTILVLQVVSLGCLRQESLLHPGMAVGFVNLIVYYGVFHFDKLKWSEDSGIINKNSTSILCSNEKE